MLFRKERNIIELLYEPDFKEKMILIKTRLIQMRQELIEHYKKKSRRIGQKN